MDPKTHTHNNFFSQLNRFGLERVLTTNIKTTVFCIDMSRTFIGFSSAIIFYCVFIAFVNSY